MTARTHVLVHAPVASHSEPWVSSHPTGRIWTLVSLSLRGHGTDLAITFIFNVVFQCRSFSPTLLLTLQPSGSVSLPQRH